MRREWLWLDEPEWLLPLWLDWPWLLLLFVDLPCLLFEWLLGCSCELEWLFELGTRRMPSLERLFGLCTLATRAFEPLFEFALEELELDEQVLACLVCGTPALVLMVLYEFGICTLLIESETPAIVLFETLSEKPQTLYAPSM